MNMDVQVITRCHPAKQTPEVVAVIDGTEEYAKSLIPGLERARIADAVQQWRRRNNIDPVPETLTLAGEFSYQVEKQPIICYR